MDYLVFHKLLQIVGFSDTEVASFSEVGWSKCLGESMDLEGRTEDEFVDEEFGGGRGIESQRNNESEELRVSLLTSKSGESECD